MDDVERVPCIICGQDDSEIVVAGDRGRHIVRCRRDGLLYMNPRPGRTSFAKFFETEYINERTLPMFLSFRAAMLRREADAIKRIKRGGRLLDVGCATGGLFENFDICNWELHGVELSVTGAEVARRKQNASVFQGTLLDAKYPDEYFDVVTVLDALFFFPDPRRELTEIHRILKPDGVLAVEIPGLNYLLIRDRGPICWILDRKWSRMTPSHHLYYFSDACLRALLMSEGFTALTKHAEQASLGRGRLAAAVNGVHFGLAQTMFTLTRGRWSIAAKELYIGKKSHERLLPCLS